MLIRSTCPRDCYDRCGLLLRVADGVVDRVSGDPSHPHTRGSICGKCATAYNGLWLDDAQRLQTPLRRVGPKGAGEFVAIGWDEALQMLGGRLRTLAAEGAAASVLHAHYQGTYSAIACQFPNRFFHRYGATEIEPSTICDKAGHVALGAMYGTSGEGFDPRTLAQAKTLLLWGVNPSHSGPMTDRHWVAEFAGTTIVVDPLKTLTAARAELHLQLYPGTDVALVYGLLGVMQREGLLDEAFIARHVKGWAAVEAQLLACSPAQAATITGVPVSLIEEAARTYARAQSLLWIGIGLQRQTHGGDVTRAVGLLPAAAGQMARPGTGFLYTNGYEIVGVSESRLTATHLAPAAPLRISHMDLADALEDPARSRVLFNWNTNVLVSAPNQQRLRRSLARDDLLTVVIDLFMTDTARYADLVLPAANFMEFDDLVFSYFHRTVSAQVKVREPVGDALPNQEIFRRLAQVMGMTEPELFETDEALIADLLAQARPGTSFADLAQVGTLFVSDEIRPQFADLAFATPSGRIEIDAETFLQAGLAAAPAVRADARAPDHALRLISPSHRWLMNSTYGNDAAVRRQMGPDALLLNAADAAIRQLATGHWVEVHSAAGSLRLQVEVSDVPPPGVAVCYKSRWLQFDGQQANVNVLNPGLRGDLGDGTAVNSLDITLRPVAAPMS